MPATAESHVRRSWKPGSSSQGDRKPGVWAPWPGATMTSTWPAFPVTGVRGRCRRSPTCRTRFVGTLQEQACIAEPAEAQGGPQGGRPTRVGRGDAGQFADPAEPVADGVRVDEECPGGRL